jgi:hypothetical protein
MEMRLADNQNRSVPRRSCGHGEPSDAAKRSAKILHILVTSENYNDVGSLREARAINAQLGAKPLGDNVTQRVG